MASSVIHLPRSLSAGWRNSPLFSYKRYRLCSKSNLTSSGTESSNSLPNSESRLSNGSGSHTIMPSRPFVTCNHMLMSSSKKFYCVKTDRYPLSSFVTRKQPASLGFSSRFMAPHRQFASKSRDKDEDIFDDVEDRLMRDDDSRGGFNVMDDTAKDMAGAMYDDYGEENEYGEGLSWRMDGKTMEGSDMEVLGGDDGDDEGDEDDDGSDEDDDGSDEDSGIMNEASDEEFEEERTDDELDELLANTPLFDPPELEETGELDPDADFHFRPEGPVYYPGMEYEPEELDVTRPLPPRKREFREKEVVTVQEAIDKADFRNVRFLTRFIGETGNILARREFNMKNKSHGRITKAIKTARFFGLMPYTNMGRPRYVFNEPFDEFSEFYETDDDEKKRQEMAAGPTYQGGAPPRFRTFPQRPGGFSGQGMGRRYYHMKLTAESE